MISALIQEIREEHGISAYALAGELRLNRSVISRAESGITELPVSLLKALDEWLKERGDEQNRKVLREAVLKHVFGSEI